MIRRIAFALCLVSQAAFAQSGSAVKQSGNVTPGHVPMWTTNGIIQDGGTAFRGFLSSIGVTASGPGICQNSGPITGPYNALCFAPTSTGGGFTWYSYGGASGVPTFSINGTVYPFPFSSPGGILGPLTTTVCDVSVWNNTVGTLLADSGISFCSQSADLVLATPSGSSGSPTFRSLTNNDLPIVSLAKGGLGGSQSAATANQIPVFPGSGGAAAPKSLQGSGGLFDTICSSTIGQTWVRLSGGWGCTSLGYANPVWWGADPTGISDSASALNSAIAASSYIQFPPGTFLLNSQISISLSTNHASADVAGAGMENTVLNWPSATVSAAGFNVSLTNGKENVTFHDFTLETGAAGTTNAIAVAATATGITDVNSFYNLMFRGDDYGTAHYWGTGVPITNTNGFSFFNDIFLGSAGNGVGVSMIGATAGDAFNYFFDQVYFTSLDFGIVASSNVQGVYCNHCSFAGQNGVVVPGGAAGTIADISVTNSQCNVTNACVLANSTLDNLFFSGNEVFMPNTGAFGLDLAEFGGGIITGNMFQGSGGAFGTAVYLGTVVSPFATIISNNNFFTTALGINLTSGSSFNTVQGNTFLSNTANITNNATATSIVNNLAYNPVGVTSGVFGTSSTAAYVSGASPETHYLTGGTVTAVKVPATTGTAVCTATPCTIDMGPNETFSVTYSGAPTDTKSVH